MLVTTWEHMYMYLLVTCSNQCRQLQVGYEEGKQNSVNRVGIVIPRFDDSEVGAKTAR